MAAVAFQKDGAGFFNGNRLQVTHSHAFRAVADKGKRCSGPLSRWARFRLRSLYGRMDHRDTERRESVPHAVCRADP